MPTTMDIWAHRSTHLPFHTVWPSQNRDSNYWFLSLLFAVSLPKLFPLFICLWIFQTSTLISYAFLPHIISTGNSMYKKAQWLHPLSPKDPSLLNKCLATKIMTEKDVDILHHNMFFFTITQPVLILPHTLSFSCYAAFPEQRRSCRTPPEQAGLSKSGSDKAQYKLCLLWFTSNCLNILWHLPQQWLLCGNMGTKGSLR